jgi:hypothetical protein
MLPIRIHLSVRPALRSVVAPLLPVVVSGSCDVLARDSAAVVAWAADVCARSLLRGVGAGARRARTRRTESGRECGCFGAVVGEIVVAAAVSGLAGTTGVVRGFAIAVVAWRAEAVRRSGIAA